MKILFTFLLSVFLSALCHAQIAVYMRMLDYSNNNIYNSGVAFPSDPKAYPTNTRNLHADEVAISTYSDGDEQTLNIGSQGTGSGAGKVAFNPLSFSKTPDAQSPKFFEMMASGTPYKFVEFSFYKTAGTGSEVLTYKIRLGLVAFSAIQRASAACSGNCPDIVENFAMQYGGKYIVYYSQKPDGSPGTPVGYGWDRIHNVSWNGATTIQ
ncbi:MAG: type VI secretion system tube protein Hcp [Bacteroidota bacterium]|nr:type VI secretion system tube protein Hcp [Bacteroidota bacterium]